MLRLFEKKVIVGSQIQTFLLKTKLRGKETEFAEARRRNERRGVGFA